MDESKPSCYDPGCYCHAHGGELCVTHVPIFANLEPPELAKIQSLVVSRRYSAGSPIFMEGEPGVNLYIIRSGKVKIFKLSKEGKEQILRILNEGEFFGELNLFQEEILSSNAEALQDCEICMIRRADMQRIMSETPRLAIEFLRVLSERLQSAERLIEGLGLQDVPHRVTVLLLDLAEKQGTRTSEGIEIKLEMNRKDLANLIGTTQETLSRQFGKLQDAGIIRLQGQKLVIIPDLDALRRIR